MLYWDALPEGLFAFDGETQQGGKTAAVESQAGVQHPTGVFCLFLQTNNQAAEEEEGGFYK